MNSCCLLPGGFPLTITGQGFASGATVSVGSSACVVTSTSVLEVICTMPAEVRDTQIYICDVYRPCVSCNVCTELAISEDQQKTETERSVIFLHKTNQNRIEWTMKYRVCNCILDLMLPGHKHQWRSGSYHQSRHYSPDVTHGLYLLLSQYTCGVSYLCHICECLGLVGNFITYDNLLWGFSSTLLHATHHQVNVFLIGPPK